MPDRRTIREGLAGRSGAGGRTSEWHLPMSINTGHAHLGGSAVQSSLNSASVVD